MKDVHRPDLPNVTNIARESAIDNSYDVLVEWGLLTREEAQCHV